MQNNLTTVEQLNALSAKICELLQVNADKAETVVPETLQQIVALEFYNNLALCIVLTLISFLLCYVIVKLVPKVFIEGDSPEQAVFIVMLGGLMFGLAFALAHLIMSVIPTLIKASVAPNLIIIEKLGEVIQ